MPIDINTLSYDEQIQLIYTGYYGRAAEPDGFQFWHTQLDGGFFTPSEIGTMFFDQEETRDVYGLGGSVTEPADLPSAFQFIKDVYQNLFDRQPNAEGYTFWGDVLAKGDMPVGEIILEIAKGAQEPDKTALLNKIEAGLDWKDAAEAAGVETVDPDPSANDSNYDAARDAVGDVNENPASLAAAKAATAVHFNDAPVAADDAASADEDAAVTVDVLTNDTDANGDTLTVASLGSAANGTLVDNGNGTVTYTPDSDFTGTDSFTYTVSDGNGGTDTATVNVDVDPVNDAPVAADDAASADEDAAVIVDVLTNDTDIDGDALTVASLGSAANGTLVDNGNGTVTYTPNTDFTGTDSFTYTVSDGNGGTDTATVNVDVVTPAGQTFTLTDGVDAAPAFVGGEGDDTFKANQDTLNNSDDLDGGGVGEGDSDILNLSVQAGTGDFFAAPTLANIETLEVNGPNLSSGQDITLDLSNASGYETLRSFQTTTVSTSPVITPFSTTPLSGPSSAPLVSFLDIQDANNTNIEIIDTNADHLYTYDTNAMTLFGGDDDRADILLQEVDGSDIDLEMETPVAGTPGDTSRSHLDAVTIDSIVQPGQVSQTGFNFVHDLNVGPVFNELDVTGDADLEIEHFLDENVDDVDATALDGDLALDLYGQGVRSNYDIDGERTLFNVSGGITVLGAIGDTRIDVSGDTNGRFIFQDENDLLRVGNSSDESYIREDVFGHLDVEMMGGDDVALLNITGVQDVRLGEGDDYLEINGNVDDLGTPLYNDGQSFVGAGDGNDDVVLNGQTDSFTNNVDDLDNDYRVLLGSGNDSLTANQGGDHIVDGGTGEDDITITGNGSNVINSGEDDDAVQVTGDGDQTVTTGAGNDDVTLNSNGDHTVSMGEGNDEGTINGDGVHDISLGAGNDDFTIDGSRLPSNNIDNTFEDLQTKIDAGTGDDYVKVDGDHYLDADMGAGNDTMELNTDELSADDYINGNTGTDRMVLQNASGELSTGRVGASETSSAPSFEIFDLRNSNIDLRLTSDNFDSTDAGKITVVTTAASEVELPRVPLSGLGLQDVLYNGMSRGEYNDVSAQFSGLGTLEQYLVNLVNNGVNSIHFVDENADTDADVSFGGAPAPGDRGSDTVDFQREVDGAQTIDITDIPLSVASGRSFELQGGNIRDIVVADDASISGRLALDYDFSTDTNQSAEDTLQIIDGAQITAADLRNVNGLEIMELMSDSNDAQTWDIELNDRVINQTTGNAPLIIRVDPDVPANSQVNIQLDPSIWGATATNDVIIETVANAEIYVNGSLVSEPDYGNDLIPQPGALGTVTVVERLVYTQNSDSLVGRDGVDDTFIVDSMSKLQTADSAFGNGDPAPTSPDPDQDVLLLDNVTVTNQGDDLFTQINETELNDIEEIVFDTGLNVQMTALDAGSGILSDMLNTVQTGSGNDTLLQMEDIGANPDQGYFLGGGDDIFETEGYDIGTTGTFGTYWVDGGLGDDEAGVSGEDYLHGTDIELITLEGSAGADVRTQEGTNGNTMTITGRPDTNNSNAVTLNSPIAAAAGGLATVMLEDIEFVYDNGGNNTIELDNDRTPAADSDAYVNLNDGDDSLTVTNVDELTVEALSGTKTVNVGGGNLSNVNDFTYTGGSSTDSGVDNITAVIDDDAVINTGGLADDIDITTTLGGNVTANGEGGDDTIKVDSDGTASVSGGTGADDIEVLSVGDATVAGNDGDDEIVVEVDGAGIFVADVSGGDGDDTIEVTVDGDDTSTIDTGLGNDDVTLLDASNGGEDTIVFGDIVYDVQQEVAAGTTQNFTQNGVDDPSYTGTANDGIDTITGFNMEGGGAGAEDILDVSAFGAKFVSTDATADTSDFEYGDWTGGGQMAQTKVGSGAGSKEVAVIGVDDTFELDGSHIKLNSSSTDPGIYVGDNDARVVVAAKDSDGDNAFDTADVYFVQDVDQDGGQAWAVDQVATVDFATEIGAITSIDAENFIF